jgi:hypothetical protein
MGYYWRAAIIAAGRKWAAAAWLPVPRSVARVFPMRSLAVAIAAAALMAHALLGCCWHHAHLAVEHSSEAEHPAVKPVVHGDHVHWVESEHERSDGAGHNHEAPDGCDEAECIYASAPRVQLESPLAGLGVPLVAAVTTPVVSRFDAAFAAELAAEGSSRPPIHLLYQVLIV